MNKKTILAIAAILVVLGAGFALARPANGGFWDGMMGGYAPGYGMMGRGMMGGNGFGGAGFGMMGNVGSGMMGGQGGSIGACGTMMGFSGDYGVNATPITIEKAKEAVEQYLASTGNADLKLSEVMEFSNHFYAEVEEKSTGVHAFELLVNKYTGVIIPEMGPNMMWNTRYSPMAGMIGGQVQASITEKQALAYAQKYLDRVLPGTEADEADAFYGYYTVHVVKDGKIYGMLSVNSNTGAVWYHSWHGTFIRIMEVE